MTLQIISGMLLMAILGIILYVKFAPQFGTRSKAERMERIYHSPNFKNGSFQNLTPTPMAAENTSMLKSGLKFITKSKRLNPEQPIETIKFDKEKFIQPKQGLFVSWFGHSTLILNMEGKIILTDPVFSENASPFSFMGVKRFNYTTQFSASDLPEIDYVLISHDHYDHLDYKTILLIHLKVKKFIVPLGIAAHLIHWGVPAEKIIELDWWEEINVDEGIKMISSPSRHFSGRAGVDKDYTLWCSWVVKTENRSFFYSGDSGYGNHFKQIGDKFGPFDLAMMECGQYNQAWPYIHMMPEQSVQASKDLKAEVMIPIHWGKFNLSLHHWTEPLERAQKEAKNLQVNLLNPMPGEIIAIGKVKNPQPNDFSINKVVIIDE